MQKPNLAFNLAVNAGNHDLANYIMDVPGFLHKLTVYTHHRAMVVEVNRDHIFDLHSNQVSLFHTHYLSVRIKHHTDVYAHKIRISVVTGNY